MTICCRLKQGKSKQARMKINILLEIRMDWHIDYLGVQVHN